jgi:hypothetical protein
LDELASVLENSFDLDEEEVITTGYVDAGASASDVAGDDSLGYIEDPALADSGVGVGGREFDELSEWHLEVEEPSEEYLSYSDLVRFSEYAAESPVKGGLRVPSLPPVPSLPDPMKSRIGGSGHGPGEELVVPRWSVISLD